MSLPSTCPFLRSLQELLIIITIIWLLWEQGRGAPAPSSQVTLSHLAPGHSVIGEPHALVLCQWEGLEAVLTCWHDILPGLDSAWRLWLQWNTLQFKGRHRNMTVLRSIRDSLVFRSKNGPPSCWSSIQSTANSARELCSSSQLAYRSRQ